MEPAATANSNSGATKPSKQRRTAEQVRADESQRQRDHRDGIAPAGAHRASSLYPAPSDALSPVSQMDGVVSKPAVIIGDKTIKPSLEDARKAQYLPSESRFKTACWKVFKLPVDPALANWGLCTLCFDTKMVAGSTESAASLDSWVYRCIFL